MKHFKLLLFAFTLLFSVSAIAAPTTEKGPKAKKEHKTTAEKKDKKFATVTYYYTPGAGGITNPSNWSTTGPDCGTGTTNLCSITFNTDTYPLEDGLPSETVLNKVANPTTGWTSGSGHQYTIDSGNITITRKS